MTLRCPFCGSEKVSEHEGTTYHWRCEAKACQAQWNRGPDDKAQLVEVLVIITGKLHQLARACAAYDVALQANNHADTDVLYHDMMILARRVLQSQSK